MPITWLQGRQGYIKLKQWIEAHERSLVSAFLLGGFLLHYFTFKSLEVGITLVGLGIYLLLAATSIVYIAFSEKHAADGSHPVLARLQLAAPFVLQIAFGSLLSMALLFYWFSGSLSASWPMFAILIGLIFFNETFRRAYLKPWVQITLFSFVLSAYISILLPYLLHSLEPWVVLVGGVASLLLSLSLVWVLLRFTPTLRSQGWRMSVSVLLVFCVLSTLYLTNLIPPIPLSLRAAGVYHDVHRAGNEYVLTGESETFWQRLLPGQTLHLDTLGRVYVYTSIYSPTDIDTTIYHKWEFYDDNHKTWTTTDRLSFPIAGGRLDGYRGYTFKTNPKAGEWRVSIETARGQVLGRVRFTAVK